MDKKAKIALVVVFLLAAVSVATVVIAKPTILGRAVAACRDSIDNDGDSYTDWPSDPGCVNKNDNNELNPNVQCDDGVDNDGDGQVDYPNDGGCSSPTDNDETNCGDSVCEGGEVCDVCVADCGVCNTCTDTDRGFVPAIQGTVSGYQGGSPYSYTDACLSSANLTEWSCNYYNQPRFDYVDCGWYNGNCVEGACINST